MSKYFLEAQRYKRGELLRRCALAASLSLFLTSAIGGMIILSARDSDASSTIPGLSLLDSSPEMIEVLVPAQPINAGSALEPLMFRIESRPKNLMSSTVFTSFEQVKGLYAKTLIVADQPLASEYTSIHKPVNEVTNAIPEGYRGVTIRVDERSGIEGWARAGSRVDVAWVSTVVGRQAITTIVQNALVISAGRNVNGDYPNGTPAPEELTLLVTKEDARRIILGQSTGMLSLSLRGMIDTGKGDRASTITTDDLLGIKGGATRSVRIIVVGVQNDNGIYDYFNWEGGKLVPRMDSGPF